MITKLYWVLPEPLKEEKSCGDYLPACPALLWKWRNFPFRFYGISKDYKHRRGLAICGGEELSV